ncbi:hypothetical protein BDP27DRAFT_1311488 [Rhodocollybia butyracea]|uniref:Uncharacterized protein n=1 Tax=Rhodocollybia butyracea TaxID=206335 RepID=A0A9P5UFW3_9AGAR|nr:hypothetical protein BDP27DRAFT_1311488 [Rhodocollybia butyracea]
MPIGISEVELLTVFLSSVFWGMYLITSAYCLRYLLWESNAKGAKLKPASSINWLMLAMALVLLILCTFNTVLLVVRPIQAFIFFTGPGGPTTEFVGLSHMPNILGTCNIAFGKLISDAILIYRCWIVLNRSITVVAFPFLLWLGEVAMVLFIIFLEASARGKPPVLLTEAASDPQAAISAAWTISLAINIITTGFIVYRIWRITMDSVQDSPGLSGRSVRRKTRLQRVTRIIIESGLMYTTVAFITFVTFAVGNDIFYMLSNVELQILSIAFNLIIIRVSTQPSGSENYIVQSDLIFAPPRLLQQGASLNTV